MMEYVVNDYSEQVYGCSPFSLTDLNAVRQMEQKFFLLPSVTWALPGPSAPQIFFDFLEHAALHTERLVLADTSFTGGGIRSVLNRLHEHLQAGGSLPKEVMLIGVVDATRGLLRFKAPRDCDKTITTAQGKPLALKIRKRWVVRLVSEDVVALVGYKSIKAKHALVGERSRELLIVYSVWPWGYLVPGNPISTVFAKLVADARGYLRAQSQSPRNLFRFNLKHYRRFLGAWKSHFSPRKR